MSDCVWISTAPGHASNQRRLRHSFSDTELKLFAVECGKNNMSGEPLGGDCFPKSIYGAPDAKEGEYKLPDLFFAGSYWAVSKAAADVLNQFNLGGGGLYGVRVLKKDRQTPVEGEWFCINFGNTKRTFAPEQSINVELRTAGQWVVRAALADNDIALSRANNGGADIWIEPTVRSAFFLSELVGKALKNAKADKGFFLKRCRVV